MNRLELRNVKKSYGTYLALQEMSYTFKPGIYGIIGPNGAGKSTLLKMMATIHAPDEGHLFYNEKDLFTMGAAYR